MLFRSVGGGFLSILPGVIFGVTFYAMLVEHGLDESRIIERVGPIDVRADFRRRALHRRGAHGRLVGSQRQFRFVASAAGEAFARMNVGDRPHRLDGQTAGVQSLEVEWYAHGGLEISAAVIFDRYRTKHRTSVGLAGDADCGLFGGAVDFGSSCMMRSDLIFMFLGHSKSAS